MQLKIYDKCNDVSFLIVPAFSTYPMVVYQYMHNSRNITAISWGNKIPFDRNNFWLWPHFFESDGLLKINVLFVQIRR